MHDSIQGLLDQLTASNDKSLTVFDLQIRELNNGTLSLNGKILDQDQLAAVKGTLIELVQE